MSLTNRKVIITDHYAIRPEIEDFRIIDGSAAIKYLWIVYNNEKNMDVAAFKTIDLAIHECYYLESLNYSNKKEKK